MYLNITRLMLELKTVLYACGIKARFLFYFLSHINTGRVFADDDGNDVTYNYYDSDSFVHS